jgi:hypothetical protein
MVHGPWELGPTITNPGASKKKEKREDTAIRCRGLSQLLKPYYWKTPQLPGQFDLTR